MTATLNMPDYLTVPAEQLGSGTTVAVQVTSDMQSLAEQFAQMLFDEIRNKPDATLIVPVGPVDQYPILARMINEHRLDCSRVMLINMDEYLAEDDQWIDIDHPLSFRGYMNRKFYDLVDPQLLPDPMLRLVPDPQDPGIIARAIQQRGGVDTCYGGIGINGHIAFNEPPEPGESVADDAFANRPTRVLSLSRETRTINSNTVGGEITIIPHRAVTVGMKEILSARRLRFFCNRPWQSAVVRRVLHGPVTAACPASFLRNHADAALLVTEEVACPPDIRLR